MAERSVYRADFFGEVRLPRNDVDPVPVLYVGGMGRSGSTLLGRLLAHLPGFWSVGELVFLWKNGLLENRLCGCGVPFLECAFWSAVGERAYGGWSNVDAEYVLRTQLRIDRSRYIPLLLKPEVSAPFRLRLDHFTDVLARLYAAVKEVSGCSVVVDSSKNASYAYILRHVDNVDFRVVHLVRDVRGVAYSWGKRAIPRPEVLGRLEYMDAHSTGKVVQAWLTVNALFELLARRGTPSTLVRYEHFVREPHLECARLMEFAGVDVAPAALDALLDASPAHLMEHSVAGNPMRFNDGPLRLRPDEEWRDLTSRRRRLAITTLGGVGLFRYGYLQWHP